VLGWRGRGDVIARTTERSPRIRGTRRRPTPRAARRI